MFRVSICHMQLATIGCTRAFFAIQCLLRIWEILGRSFLECCGHVEVPLFSVTIGSVERNRTEHSKKTNSFSNTWNTWTFVFAYFHWRRNVDLRNPPLVHDKLYFRRSHGMCTPLYKNVWFHICIFGRLGILCVINVSTHISNAKENEPLLIAKQSIAVKRFWIAHQPIHRSFRSWMQQLLLEIRCVHTVVFSSVTFSFRPQILKHIS